MILLLLRGAILRLCSLKMLGKVRKFDHDWRVATLLLNHVLPRLNYWRDVVIYMTCSDQILFFLLIVAVIYDLVCLCEKG